jgi:hypothetical protein
MMVPWLSRIRRIQIDMFLRKIPRRKIRIRIVEANFCDDGRRWFHWLGGQEKRIERVC